MIDNEAMRGRLIAVALTPFDAAGELHRPGLRQLVSHVAGTGIAGVAVGTPLGRGPRLSPEVWGEVLSTWRGELDRKTLMIASVGASPAIRRPSEVFEATLEMARRAAELGADALLVQPPGAVRGRPERDRLILEYHSVVAEADLPILVSYRREVSGGIAYGPDVLAQLLARPEVLGIEIATIDGIATFQQVEALARELAPNKLVVSGEDRFLGYSLMAGADAAMVGLASVFPSVVLELLEAHFAGKADQFLKLSKQVDALALPIFRAPLEAAPLRLLQTLVHQGVIPPEAAHDPH